MKKLLFCALLASCMLACTNYNTPSNPTEQSVEGELSGEFSVSPTQKVHFSKGNLQYNIGAGVWRFAEHQYDTIGAVNANIPSEYRGWMDLFGWCTGNNPTLISEDYSDYSVFIDWGVNAITNGGGKRNLWRTLTITEWEYLCRGRANASTLLGTGTINGILGAIFLPDNGEVPAGISFNYLDNKYTIAQWAQLERIGAVFLPAAGYRQYGYINELNKEGEYWSETPYNRISALFLGLDKNSVGAITDYSPYGAHRDIGCSVRLVRDIK